MRRRNRKQQIAISEGELVAMTHDLDDVHHESLPSMRDSLAEWSESDDDIRTGITRLVSTPSSRRAFLLGGGAVIGGVALVGSGMGSGIAAAATRTGHGRSLGHVGAEAQRRPRRRRARGVAREPGRRHLPGRHRRRDQGQSR